MVNKKYILIYIDPLNPHDLNEGDTEIVGIGTINQIIEQAVGDRNNIVEDDDRIGHHLIFELNDGKKVSFTFPKPKIKII